MSKWQMETKNTEKWDGGGLTDIEIIEKQAARIAELEGALREILARKGPCASTEKNAIARRVLGEGGRS